MIQQQKHTEPYELDGVWHAANACKQCRKWLPPYMAGIPTEIADQYCWGHNWALLRGSKLWGPWRTKGEAIDAQHRLGSGWVMEMERDDGP